MVVLPRPVVQEHLASANASSLFTADVGYFPEAVWHEVSRPLGSPQLIVIVCARGKGWCMLGGRRHEVPAGSALIIPPGLRHSYGADEDNAWTIYWAHVAGRLVPAILRLFWGNGAGGVISIGEGAELFELIEEIYETLRQGYASEQLLLSGFMTGRLIGTLVELHRQHPEHADVRARIDRVISYVSHRLKTPIQVPELARLADLSTSHFAAKFKRQTGHAVLDYFIRLRLQRAAHLLDTTQMPIKSVAAEIGYEDPLYFSRAFRKVHDLSPAQYRAIKKG
jgi:AraC-like DNA-binding protein